MSDWTREESLMDAAPPAVTLGRLTLIKRKGGGDVQSIPLDAERITFGRDYDCDVRLYYSDVSKLHCEILFDSVTGNAILNVLGTNGLLHTPSGGSSSTYKPPATIELSDRDLITIRKKPFRFEYGAGPEPQIPFSPGPKSSDYSQAVPSPIKRVPGSPAQGLRRRASHRLSLVPEGKTFVPLSPAKNRRHSAVGLGDMRTPVKAPSKSKLSEEIPQEHEEEEAEEPVIDIANGDEGDKVYVEMTEEEEEQEGEMIQSKPIHDNPFMTPQQTRKAPLRNTSAVPRTCKVAIANKAAPMERGSSEGQAEKAVKVDITPATPPKSPRSVPLPAAMDTPYNPPATPASQKMSATPVPARVALSTPKGPATLRKALLLRSARKVWQESRDAGVDGAIQNGSVETRRKSLSPITRAGRKSTTPMPEVPAEPNNDDEDEHEKIAESNSAEDPTGPSGQLQWVYEDGTAEASFESDSSGGDSLEADTSLDIPGRGIINFSSTAPGDEEEYMNENLQAQEGDEDEDLSVEDDEQEDPEYQDHEEALKDPVNELVVPHDEAIDEGDQPENVHEEYEEAATAPAHQSIEDDEVIEVESDDEEGDDQATSLPGTPQSRKCVPSQFFTPQPARGSYGHSRRSLGGVGGAPVRLGVMPSTPNSLRPMRTPGSLGKPSRGVWTTVAAPIDDGEFEEPEESKRKKPSTPAKSAASIAEMKRRRETLATPRSLPTPPATGFKDPIHETRFADLLSTPGHRALAPQSPEPEEPEQEKQAGRAIPGTPMDDLKKRLDKMRRQSTQRTDRRATVGFALPSTPSQPIFNQAGSHSVNPRRIFGKGPRTPVFPKLKREGGPSTSIGSSQLPVVPVNEEAEPEQEANRAVSPAAPRQPSSPIYDPPSSPSTPLYTGLKEMLKPPHPAKTPNMAGIKNLFPATAKEAATPSFVGVKEMLKQPAVPATPSFSGMREMFKQRPEPPTPIMEGLNEMYEAEAQEEVEMDQTEDVIVVEVEEFPEAENQMAVREPTIKHEEVDATGNHYTVARPPERKAGEESEEEEEEEVEEIEVEPERVIKNAPSRPASPRKAASTSTASARSQRAASPKKSIPKAVLAAAAPAKASSRIPARRTVPTKTAEMTKAAEPASRPARARKPAEPAASSRAEPVSRPSRSTRATSVASTEDGASTSSRAAMAAAATASSRSRSTRAKSTAEPEEMPQPAPEPVKAIARSRSTSTRTVKKAEGEENSKPSRGKKPLTEIEEQVKDASALSAVEEKRSTSSRAKRATPAASAPTVTAKRATTARTSTGAEKNSAPSRRKVATSATTTTAGGAALNDKENDETQVEDKKSTSAASKRRVVSKATAGAGEEGKSGVPVPVARATRSRK
ncbi:hypothetical protein IAT40_001144 [Kwoniella sp. CBS 6097]